MATGSFSCELQERRAVHPALPSMRQRGDIQHTTFAKRKCCGGAISKRKTMAIHALALLSTRRARCCSHVALLLVFNRRRSAPNYANIFLLHWLQLSVLTVARCISRKFAQYWRSKVQESRGVDQPDLFLLFDNIHTISSVKRLRRRTAYPKKPCFLWPCI